MSAPPSWSWSAREYGIFNSLMDEIRPSDGKGPFFDVSLHCKARARSFRRPNADEEGAYPLQTPGLPIGPLSIETSPFHSSGLDPGQIPAGIG